MIRRILIAIPIVLVAWIGILALVMRVSDEAPAAFVPFPSAQLVANLPDTVSVTDHSQISLTFQSDRKGLTERLYAAGAWVVLPAMLENCIPAFLRNGV